MILRSYMCGECAHSMTVELRSDEWDAPAPLCPRCEQMTHQEFAPVNIGGSNAARAVKLAENIAEHDYGVADFTAKSEAPADVRYRDSSATPSSWIGGHKTIEAAIASGRQDRLRYGGSGLDVLQKSLADGSQPDLIAQARKRGIRVW